MQTLAHALQFQALWTCQQQETYLPAKLPLPRFLRTVSLYIAAGTPSPIQIAQPACVPRRDAALQLCRAGMWPSLPACQAAMRPSTSASAPAGSLARTAGGGSFASSACTDLPADLHSRRRTHTQAATSIAAHAPNLGAPPPPADLYNHSGQTQNRTHIHTNMCKYGHTTPTGVEHASWAMTHGL